MKYQPGDVIHYKDRAYTVLHECKLRTTDVFVDGYVYQAKETGMVFARDQKTIEEKYLIEFKDFDDGGVLPKDGARVRTKMALGSIAGFMIKPSYLDNRKANTLGRYRGYVGGHGGDVWWVEHDDGVRAAYAYSEMQVAT